MSAVVAVRLTEPIRTALARAAAEDAIPPATVARQAIVRELRRRNYLADADGPTQEPGRG